MRACEGGVRLWATGSCVLRETIRWARQDIFILSYLGVCPGSYFEKMFRRLLLLYSILFCYIDDEEGDMRRRGARECNEALMEATEARRGYAKVAAWDEGNLIQAMARLKNPTIAWRYGDG